MQRLTHWKKEGLKMQNRFFSKVRKMAKIRNQYNQAPHLTQDTNGKVTNTNNFGTKIFVAFELRK